MWCSRLGLGLALELQWLSALGSGPWALGSGSGPGPGVRPRVRQTVCECALSAPVRLREVKQGRAKKSVVVRYTVVGDGESRSRTKQAVQQSQSRGGR